MHVIVATDGSLEATKTAKIAASLAGGDGQVTVLSVVEVPREMLNAMRRAAADSSGPTNASVDPEFRRTQASDTPPTRWVGDDVVVKRYVDNTVSSRTSELAAALESLGVDFSVLGIEGESAARSIL
jgi:nucleotide-binding universal stress UspA family protein